MVRAAVFLAWLVFGEFATDKAMVGTIRLTLYNPCSLAGVHEIATAASRRRADLVILVGTQRRQMKQRAVLRRELADEEKLETVR